MTPPTVSDVELRRLLLPMRGTFQSAIGVRTRKEALLVIVVTEDGSAGYGECSCRTDPYFSYEFVDAVVVVLQKFILPELIGMTPAEAIASVTSSRVRGWPFARAAVLAAVDDVAERVAADGEGRDRTVSVRVGATLGIPASAPELARDLATLFDAGYARVRVKGRLDLDWKDISRVLADGVHDGRGFAVDFNGSLDEDDIRAHRLLEFLGAGLRHLDVYVEQPFAPETIAAHRRLRETGFPIRICLDESITGLEPLRYAHETGALDMCNIKPGRVGGARTASRLAEYCRGVGLPAHLGGMLETGIGRWANARLAARTLPRGCHDMTLPRDYLTKDLIDNPITLDPGDGTISVGDGPAPVNTRAIDEATLWRWSARG